jgi:hypothetical protein
VEHGSCTDSPIEQELHTLTPIFLASSLFSSKFTLTTTISGFSPHSLLTLGYKPLQLAHHGAKNSTSTSLSVFCERIATCMTHAALDKSNRQYEQLNATGLHGGWPEHRST